MGGLRRVLTLLAGAGAGLVVYKLLTGRVSVERSLDVECLPDRLWQLLSDFQRWPEWNQSVAFVTADRGFPIGLGDPFTWGDGQRTFDSTVYQFQPHRALSLTGVSAESTLDFRLEIQPRPNGVTRLVARQRLDGLLPRLLSGVYRQATENGLEAWLWQAKVAAEA